MLAVMLNKRLVISFLCLNLSTFYSAEKLELLVDEYKTNQSIVIVGSGYVGLVSGACFAEFGFDVTNVDIDEEKIRMLSEAKIPIYEPGLESLVKSGIAQKKLNFTTNLKEAVEKANAIMIAVGTPERPDGGADLSYIFQAAKQIATHLTNYATIVTKSTVPVGTSQQIAEIITQTRPDLKRGIDFDVASNPEFLREGSAINDFMYPDRVVIGTDSAKAKQVLGNLYSLVGAPILFTDIKTSELIKYAANGFLALKISFANQLSNLCEKTGTNIEELIDGIGSDSRIGRKFLNPGPGYGGSCFPKDTQALKKTAEDYGSPLSLISTVIEFNEERKQKLANKIVDLLKERSISERSQVAVLGVTFKAETDDLRSAASRTIIPYLHKAGINVCVYDPVYHLGSEKLKFIETEWPYVVWKESPYQAIENSDTVVILTEWEEFKTLDLKRVASALRVPNKLMGLIIDYRNMFDLSKMENFEYHSLGRLALNRNTQY